MRRSKKSWASNWYDIESVDARTYRIRVKWWHHGFWFEAYRTLRDAGAGRFEAAHLTLVFIFVMLKGKR